MFDIISVSSPTGSYILLGGPSGKSVVGPTSPLGPQGATYIIALPGLGYIKLVDAGNSVSGPGDWSVSFSNSSTNWFYRGQGQAQVTVQSSGSFTVTGGGNTITGRVVPW